MTVRGSVGWFHCNGMNLNLRRCGQEEGCIESRWEWVDPALAPWPQGQCVRPWAGPFYQNFVAPLTHWVHEADPKFSKCLVKWQDHESTCFKEHQAKDLNPTD